MKRKLAVVIKELTETQRGQIRAAAEKNGFEIRFMNSPAEDPGFLREAEVVFGHLPETAASSQTLKWICTPFLW